ncbi:MAG: hypothetical protein U9N72_05700 [Bacteroidota bacterium]|nr:hypothetical protein [Bacteroidota bacterium]
MKKLIILLAISSISLSAMSQQLEFDLRGGINFQGSHSPDKNTSLLPHIGLMAGLKISTMGIYGEVLFSIHDDNDWAERANYFVASTLLRYYGFQPIYIEGGLSYYILAEEQIEGSAPALVSAGLILACEVTCPLKAYRPSPPTASAKNAKCTSLQIPAPGPLDKV